MQYHSPTQYVGDIRNVMSAGLFRRPEGGTLVQRKDGKPGDGMVTATEAGGPVPAVQPHRVQVPHHQGRSARLSISLGTHQAHVPERAETQANGRILRPVMGENNNFWDGPTIAY